MGRLFSGDAGEEDDEGVDGPIEATVDERLEDAASVEMLFVVII